MNKCWNTFSQIQIAIKSIYNDNIMINYDVPIRPISGIVENSMSDFQEFSGNLLKWMCVALWHNTRTHFKWNVVHVYWIPLWLETTNNVLKHSIVGF